MKHNGEQTYHCACVFVDNSGFDIVLGVFPFVRELLRNGSKVILSANSRPVLNDVTHNELIQLTALIAERCEIIKEALDSKRLLIIENGQCSPCLDLRHIDDLLARTMVEQGVDLIILEGMGRAIHTNFNAEFKCPVLKTAVIKNKWLANRLGGELFSVVFRYESSLCR
ncbi:unnamed protein product [Soboliphyme baturini]|uniref:4'-phosphopantetheine phosphatase n=1 Tax=Soboliphyme baturini TaxID=241478 RepID=A0A183IUI8_9BILA|nr:unnamed protein product [Soboliphyme baturini]